MLSFYLPLFLQCILGTQQDMDSDPEEEVKHTYALITTTPFAYVVVASLFGGLYGRSLSLSIGSHWNTWLWEASGK